MSGNAIDGAVQCSAVNAVQCSAVQWKAHQMSGVLTLTPPAVLQCPSLRGGGEAGRPPGSCVHGTGKSHVICHMDGGTPCSCLHGISKMM